MNECERFLDRLFDVDARRALESRTSLPDDIRNHAAECAECSRAASMLAEDLRAIPAALSEVPPNRPSAATREALARAFPPRLAAQIEWRTAGLWGLSGGSAAVCLLILSGVGLSWAWQLVVFATVGVASLSTEITRQALEATDR